MQADNHNSKELPTAAQLLVKCLENEGVEYIFGLPGEENIDVMDALLDSKIKFVTTHHEQGAAFMADLYGRLTGRAGVCLATLGPGASLRAVLSCPCRRGEAPVIGVTSRESIGESGNAQGCRVRTDVPAIGRASERVR
jgi:acetolactate synthase-1/2/3 large subunit